MDYSCIITLFLYLLALLETASAYEASSFWVWACPGQQMSNAFCQIGVLRIKSITVFSTTDTAGIIASGTKCFQGSSIHQCERRITTADTGLSSDYRYLYRWSVHRCNGKERCDTINLPQWWNLIGETNNRASTQVNPNLNVTCPQGGSKYVSGIMFHFSCRVGEDVDMITAPPPTTPRTRPTTPTTTPAFSVRFLIYQPTLEDRERIVLGVAIGLAIAILIVLLTILYCCDRWRNSRKFGKLLRMLGRPQPMDDGFDELDNYGRADAWKDETNNLDAIGEYTGVKPDEFLTLDKKTMEKSGLIYSDHVGTITTMGRANTASTLNRHGNGSARPNVEPGTGYYQGPVDYNTAENLELEERMAAALSHQNEVLGDTDAEQITRY